MSKASHETLAKKIAAILESESTLVPTLASLHADIKSLATRVEAIERRQAADATLLAAAAIPHPSQERFAVIEALANDIVSSSQSERACAFEPNGQPCDHCAMCSTRGF